ncbi:MAG TPA: GNAT family N-acetyltransferase [Acidimicrobiales bacterium]|nr:GNAT family N-acetyltransferase [Acidimicrobiales bacterium]
MASLRELSAGEAYAAASAIHEGYLAHRIEAGEDEASARASANAQFTTLFPGGAPAEGQHVMHVVEDGEVVGVLWMGRPFSGTPGMWWVFDVEIDEAHRGRGLGRAAMELAEEWTRKRGGTRVGLNVFGPNRVARALYDSLGYEVLATSMFKDLG